MQRRLSTGSQAAPEMQQKSKLEISQRHELALWRRRKVAEITGLQRSTMYSLIKKGLFPAPVKIGIRAVAWREQDVISWIDARSTDSFET